MPFINNLVDYNPVTIVFKKIIEKFPLFANLGEYFSDLLLHRAPDNVKKMFFALGVCTLTYKVCHKIYSFVKRWNWLIQHHQNKKRDTAKKLQQNYGKCWALVTGFTKGIGWGMTAQLAKCGYNLLLVGRDQQIMNKRIQFLKKSYPDQEYKTIVCDALKPEDVQRMKEQIKNYAQELDIGIVFNNLGNMCGGDFWTVDKKGLLHVLYVNMHFTIMMSQLMLTILRKRQKKSAMITISSCTGIYSAPFVGCYASVKNLLNIYTQSIAKQNKDKVDILSVTPFGVSTKMMNMKKGPFMVSPEQCSISILNDLGHTNHSFGEFKHKFSSAMIQGMTDREIFLMYKGLRPPHLQ